MHLRPFDVAITDIEGDGLYDTVTVIHCATIMCCLTGDSKDYGPSEIPLYLDDLAKVKMRVGHNVLDYDGPAIEKVTEFKFDPKEWFDTLVMSRLLNPDLLGGHSLGQWGSRMGEEKIDFRRECVELGYISANAPKGEEFKLFRPNMPKYCNQDCKVNLKLLQRLIKHVGWTLEDLLAFRTEEINWRK